MKKLFFLSTVIGLMAGTAAAIDIYSCNTVGVQRVTGTLSEVSAPVPFVGIGGGDATLKSLLYIDNLTTGDNIQTCIDNRYGLYSVWTAVNLPAANIVDYYANSRTTKVGATSVLVDPPSASEAVVPRGAGVKVTRANTSGCVYVMGEYTDKPITVTIGGRNRTYLVNPTDQDFDLDTKLTTAAGARYGDRIYVYDGLAEKTYIFDDEIEEGKSWYVLVNTTVNGELVGQANFESPKIKPGEGFMYYRGSTRSLTFTW